jgi:hypothetical protein
MVSESFLQHALGKRLSHLPLPDAAEPAHGVRLTMRRAEQMQAPNRTWNLSYPINCASHLVRPFDDPVLARLGNKYVNAIVLNT